jgi:flavin prenyltransferase
MKRNIVVALTGASGAAYSVRLLEVLLAADCDVHLTISASAQKILEQELDLRVDLDNFNPAMLMLDAGLSLKDQIHYHDFRDQMAPIASGSFLTDGMVVCPCSGGTLSAVVHGASINLIHRAAEVHLKERRNLILVPREMPLSLLHLENMKRAAELGAVVMPAMPGFYHGVKSIRDLVDFVVSRILDQLGIANMLIKRWGSGERGKDEG